MADSHALLIVGNETLQILDAQRLNLSAHEAGAFAMILLRTNPAGDGGKHVILADLCGCSQEIARHDRLHKLADFHAHRTIVGAGGLSAFETTLRFLARQFRTIAKSHFAETG